VLRGVLTQRFIDQSLVVAAAGRIHLPAKSFQDVFVQADGDAGLAGRHSHDSAALALGEIKFLFHICNFVSQMTLCNQGRGVRAGNGTFGRAPHLVKR
jgi:hypothetical protein